MSFGFDGFTALHVASSWPKNVCSMPVELPSNRYLFSSTLTVTCLRTTVTGQRYSTTSRRPISGGPWRAKSWSGTAHHREFQGIFTRRSSSPSCCMGRRRGSSRTHSFGNWMPSTMGWRVRLLVGGPDSAGPQMSGWQLQSPKYYNKLGWRRWRCTSTATNVRR